MSNLLKESETKYIEELNKDAIQQEMSCRFFNEKVFAYDIDKYLSKPTRHKCCVEARSINAFTTYILNKNEEGVHVYLSDDDIKAVFDYSTPSNPTHNDDVCIFSFNQTPDYKGVTSMLDGHYSNVIIFSQEKMIDFVLSHNESIVFYDKGDSEFSSGKSISNNEAITAFRHLKTEGKVESVKIIEDDSSAEESSFSSSVSSIAQKPFFMKMNINLFKGLDEIDAKSELFFVINYKLSNDAKTANIILKPLNIEKEKEKAIKKVGEYVTEKIKTVNPFVIDGKLS